MTAFWLRLRKIFKGLVVLVVILTLVVVVQVEDERVVREGLAYSPVVLGVMLVGSLMVAVWLIYMVVRRDFEPVDYRVLRKLNDEERKTTKDELKDLENASKSILVVLGMIMVVAGSLYCIATMVDDGEFGWMYELLSGGLLGAAVGLPVVLGLQFLDVDR